MTDRQITLRLAITGLIEIVKSRPPLADAESLTQRNAAEVIGRRVESLLRRTLAQWDDTDREPDWAGVVAGITTDGHEYVGPSGTWIEFGPEDAPVLAHTAETMAGEVSRYLNIILRALASPPPV